MKQIKIKYVLLSIVSTVFIGCIDNDPQVEVLPSAAVKFIYEVADSVYTLDYYTGATIRFTSISALEGTCQWDFGDGETATGEVVTHKYAEAGTYAVKLTVAGSQSCTEPIMIYDIVPILSIKSIEGGICEVLTSAVEFDVEVPNPENLSVEYLWTFPVGTVDEAGKTLTEYAGENPGKVRFGNVGSDAIVFAYLRVVDFYRANCNGLPFLVGQCHFSLNGSWTDIGRTVFVGVESNIDALGGFHSQTDVLELLGCCLRE